jgi:hypothetical protein
LIVGPVREVEGSCGRRGCGGEGRIEVGRESEQRSGGVDAEGGVEEKTKEVGM